MLTIIVSYNYLKIIKHLFIKFMILAYFGRLSPILPHSRKNRAKNAPLLANAALGHYKLIAMARWLLKLYNTSLMANGC